ncbi:MAG: FtsX-like permease family protein [Actinomycetota bacterium]|nr:FtsX-like permease family protein [Actinomycetota bacterium]
MTDRVLGLARLARRQLAHDKGPAVVLFAMVLLLVGIVCAAPAAVSSIAGREIRSTVGALSAVNRDLIEQTQLQVPVGTAPSSVRTDLPADAAPYWGALAAELAVVRSTFPPAVQAATSPARFSLRTVDVSPLAAVPGDHTGIKSLLFNVDPYLRSEVELVAGRWPADQSIGEKHYEVVLGRPAADELHWELGATRAMATPARPRVSLTLVGLIDQSPTDPDYVDINKSSIQPQIFDDGNTPKRVVGNVYLSPGAWNEFSGADSITTTLWFSINAGPLTSAGLADLTAGLRQATVKVYLFGDVDPNALGALQEARLSSELPATLDTVRGRISSASAVQAVAALGPLGAALAVLALGLQAFRTRRQSAVSLLLTRGASIWQVRRSLAAQAAVIGVPAVAVSMLGVELMFGWTVPWWALLAGVLLGLAPAVALPAGVSANRLRMVRSDFGVRAGNRIRWIVEVLVVGLAGLSLFLLLSGGLTTGAGGGADVLVAASPVFLTLAVCVLVIRLYPLPLLAIQKFLRRRSGAVGFLGALRALRDPLVGIPLILATVTGVAVAMFSVVTLSTVSSGITIAGERAVGADLSVTGAFMTENLVARARKVPGVRAATAVGLGGTLTISSGGRSQDVTLYFADTASFGDVQRDIPGAPRVPAGLTPTAAGIPVVVSDSVRAQLAAPTARSGNGKTLNIVGTGPFPTGLGVAKDWVLVDITVADSLLNTGDVPDNMLISERPGADNAAIDAAIRMIVGPNAVLQRPGDAIAALKAAPTIGGMRTALIVSTILGVLLMALAVLVTAVSGTNARNRLLAVLRLLGLNRRQVAQLASWEQTPPALTAAVVGGGFGVGLAALIGAVVDLRAFTGGAGQPALSIAPWALVVVIGGFVAVIVLAVAISAALAQRASAAVLMRTEE